MSIGSDELVLYADNTSQLYELKKDIWLRLLKRKRRGDYSPEYGRARFMSFARKAAQGYAKEISRKPTEWAKLFPARDRADAASHWEQQFRSMEKLRELEWLLPEKDRKHRPGNPHPTKKKKTKKRSKKESTRRAKLARAAAKRRQPRCPVGTEIQTLIFTKGIYTITQAKLWAKRHAFKCAKVDETKESYRIRQHAPGRYQKGSFRTISLGTVQAVIGCRK